MNISPLNNLFNLACLDHYTLIVENAKSTIDFFLCT